MRFSPILSLAFSTVANQFSSLESTWYAEAWSSNTFFKSFHQSKVFKSCLIPMYALHSLQPGPAWPDPLLASLIRLFLTLFQYCQAHYVSHLPLFCRDRSRPFLHCLLLVSWPSSQPRFPSASMTKCNSNSYPVCLVPTAQLPLAMHGHASSVTS